MKAVLLCGGQGLRLKGPFGDTPKPLVELQGRPLLGFILDHYRAHGVREFVLLVGRGEQHFHQFASRYAGATGVAVQVVQTGADTPTGGRIKRAEPYLRNAEAFFMTYGDGVSDVDLNRLRACHDSSSCLVTLTAVRARLPFGLVELDEKGGVDSFVEKPLLEQYTNGGFFVFRRDAMAYLKEDSDLERDVLPVLAAAGELNAYRHHGFWHSMDTYKDHQALSELPLAKLLSQSS